MRGQAFVVCNDEETAESIIKALRGFNFYGKPLRLNFAKKDSDYISKLKGAFDEGVLLKRDERKKEDLKARDIKAKRKLIE